MTKQIPLHSSYKAKCTFKFLDLTALNTILFKSTLNINTHTKENTAETSTSLQHVLEYAGKNTPETVLNTEVLNFTTPQ